MGLKKILLLSYNGMEHLAAAFFYTDWANEGKDSEGEAYDVF
jgi:hypothetical protein